MISGGADTELSNHFRFGENWKSFAREVDEPRIAEAMRGLAKLVPAESLAGKSFLDIGCGSGLSMLVALRLGAARVHGIDLDPASAATARALLERYASGGPWRVEERSVFDLDPAVGRFDVVYSWGVLHHTGAMWRAVTRAAAMVEPGGLLAIALYHRTLFCGPWRIVKRLYAHAPDWVQWIIRGLYKGAYLAALTAAGRNPKRYIADYAKHRGMDWHHDVHDWLGGYPYESTRLDEMALHLAEAGFTMERQFDNCAGAIGLFGTGNDECVARRSVSE